MRALDTNILVRFVTNDDANKAGRVELLFAECHRNREHLFISAPVICELVWVLKNGLRQTRAEIARVIDKLVEDDLFQIEHNSLVLRAVGRYRQGRADFADYLIGELSGHAGCRDTVTFDKALKGSPGFTLL
jgi:predicted nucleic-acid-binding protein